MPQNLYASLLDMVIGEPAFRSWSKPLGQACDAHLVTTTSSAFQESFGIAYDTAGRLLRSFQPLHPEWAGEYFVRCKDRRALSKGYLVLC